jgi:prevent-host-death family protein
MAEPRWSLQDAKNSFSAVVDAALKGTPQTVTKRGKPAVVVL